MHILNFQPKDEVDPQPKMTHQALQHLKAQFLVIIAAVSNWSHGKAEVTT